MAPHRFKIVGKIFARNVIDETEQNEYKLKKRTTTCAVRALYAVGRKAIRAVYSSAHNSYSPSAGLIGCALRVTSHGTHCRFVGYNLKSIRERER